MTRYAGPRWDIVYGSHDGMERVALYRLQAGVQRFLPYVVQARPAGEEPARHEEHHRIVLGTRESNPLVDDLAAKGAIAIPEEPEAYTAACMNSPWNPEKRLIVLAGSDERGVLYGVEEFSGQDLSLETTPQKPDLAKLREAFDSLGDFSITDYPRIDNRGIWTWGYVIYDYRGFLDNMTRLKMNMLTIWNDCPPLNIGEILDYAHARGIRIILGFHWGWGLGGLELTRGEDRKAIKNMVLENYRENYRGLGIDGIYFQTLTEHNVTEKNGMTTAAGACELVNETARQLLEEEPDLYIQFGLHATSIREHYVDFSSLDERVTIVWEDAGQLPFSYTPVVADAGSAGEPDTRTRSVEETLGYAKKLATFRPGTEFAMVPKGWVNLDWGNEFEHHGLFILGERDPEFIRERLRSRQPHWDRVNSTWLRNYPLAIRFYREILECRPRRMTVTGLVEDGLFEARIQPSVALFGETIWNPYRDEGEILQRAMNPWYGRTV